MSTKPEWAPFVQEYRGYDQYTSLEVKSEIGGAVDADWIANTCVVRISRALNYSGSPVPSGFAGLLTVKGADGKNYALRVAEMRKYLKSKWGDPDFNLVKSAGDSFDKTQLGGIVGILAFDISFGDATGHFDVWDGSNFTKETQSPEYWENATRISLYALQ